MRNISVSVSKDSVHEEGGMINCFLCGGAGQLSQKDLLNRLGLKPVMELLHTNSEELLKKVASGELFSELSKTIELQMAEKFEAKSDATESEHEAKLEILEAKFQLILQQKAELQEAKKHIEAELTTLKSKEKSSPALIGHSGEVDFEDWVSQFRHLRCSEKLSSTGDYEVTVLVEKGKNLVDVGAVILVDVKRNKQITADDERKIITDAAARNKRFAYLLVDSADQMREKDKANRFTLENGGQCYLLRGTRESFLQDTEFLKPYFILHKQLEQRTDSEKAKMALDRISQTVLAKLKEFDNLKKHTTKIRRATDNIDGLVDDWQAELTKLCEEALAEVENYNDP